MRIYTIERAHVVISIVVCRAVATLGIAIGESTSDFRFSQFLKNLPYAMKGLGEAKLPQNPLFRRGAGVARTAPEQEVCSEGRVPSGCPSKPFG
jgi:hypothetical protein